MRPSHYRTENGLDITALCILLDLNFVVGNPLKYVVRRGKKGSELEDLQKAKDYLNRYKPLLWASDGCQFESHYSKLVTDFCEGYKLTFWDRAFVRFVIASVFEQDRNKAEACIDLALKIIDKYINQLHYDS